MAEPSPVALSRLSLTDFRNYTSLSLEPGSRMVAFVGENGAGKTNLLEAISLLSAGRGLRRAQLADLVRRGAPSGFAISAIVDGPFGETRIGTGFTPGESGRKVRIDGEEARSSEALLDYLRVLWLLPAMDSLFSGPAGDRRRFLDRLVLAIDPGHGRRVAEFEKALRARNRLLEDGGTAAYLDALESQVAQLAIAVALARRETVQLLQSRLAAKDAADLPFPQAHIRLQGTFEDDAETMAAADLEDHYRLQLREGRARDRAAGRTLDGPHRSDLAVTHLAKAMPAAMASTGEQKGLLIGLVLAHAGLTASISGMTPVLLLDEVAAHLDPIRREALFERLDRLGGQVFMTGTDPLLFAHLPPSSRLLKVVESRIVG